MYNNSFTGFIPPSLGNISNLVHMSLSANNLRGQIPKEIGNLSNLKILRLTKNQLSGSASFIFNMSSLEEIVLMYNNLTGSIPGDMCNHLHELRSVIISFNQFQGFLPSSWYGCGKVQELSLSYNKFTGGIPRGIGNLTMLKLLYLGDNPLQGENSCHVYCSIFVFAYSL